MKRHVYANGTHELLRVEEADPPCGTYCDDCGDCMHCFEICVLNPPSMEHYWVVYEDAAETEDA